jgi:hypothetical protein
MLFAWTDDTVPQMTLNAEDEVENFFNAQTDVIFVIDQVNALKNKESGDETKRTKLYNWLMHFTSAFAAVFCSSTNFTDLRNPLISPP